MLLRQKDKHHQSLSDWPIFTGLGYLLFFQKRKKQSLFVLLLKECLEELLCLIILPLDRL